MCARSPHCAWYWTRSVPYCLQCGEPLALDAEKCPACGRAVGMSTLGRALERRAGPGKLRLLRAVALGAALVGAITIGWPMLDAYRRDRAVPGVSDFDRGARASQRSRVRVRRPDGRTESGVV